MSPAKAGVVMSNSVNSVDRIMQSLDGEELHNGMFSLATVLIGLALANGYTKDMVLHAMAVQWEKQAAHFEECGGMEGHTLQ
jgi:hypothetical protein